MIENVKAGDVQQWPIGDITPYKKNAKIHDPKDILKLTESIQKFGFRGFIRVDKNGVIIGGHKRRLAAMAAGLKFLPVIVDSHLDDSEVKAARLADNRVHGANYDESLMQEELIVLKDLDFDMDGMGFETRELDFLTNDLTEMNIDALITNLDEEVEEQTARTDQKSADAVDEEVSLGEAFGFKRVTIGQARVIGQFMSQLEEETGAGGADGLVDFFKNLTP
jgi:ParB-like chromosome segregation protein Spo0J